MKRKQIKLYVRSLADLLGWEADTKGRAWRVEDPDAFFRGLSYTPAALLAVLVRSVLAPEEYGGLGMSPEAVRALLANAGGSPTHLPTRGLSSGDEGDLYRIWPGLRG